MPRDDLIQVRADTAANWTAVDPVLAADEPGLESDTRRLKFGDGVTPWTGLPYATTGGVQEHGALAGLGDDDHPQYLTQARGDARYPLTADVTADLAGKADTSAVVLRTGSTMTGPLTLPGDPTNDLHAVTRGYLLAKVADLLGGMPPEDLNTFVEFAQRIHDGDDALTALAAVVAGKQPLDADLTAIAGLGTTAYGRDFLALIDAAAARLALGLGSAAVHSHADYDAAGAAAAAQAAAVAHAVQRVNHTGTQTSGTISDFTEAVQDAVAAMLVSGANVTLTYDDPGNSLAVTASGVDAETVRDTIGAAIAGVNGIGVAVNDAADTITLSITGVTVSQVTGLQAILDGKVPTSRLFAGLDLTADRSAAAVKTALSLGNVDNTSDADKPVSTAQQTAIRVMAGKYPAMRSGRYYGPTGPKATSAATVNTLYCVPLWVPHTVTINQVGISVTVAAGAGGVLRFGIYADSGTETPGALIEDFGTTDGTAANFRTVTVNRILTAGLYWVAICAQVAAGTWRTSTDVPSPIADNGADASGVAVGAFTQGGVTGALPANFAGAGSLVQTPRVFVRAA